MYHKSVPQIRQRLDKINADIKSLIKIADSIQIFHQSILKFHHDLEIANKLKIVKIYNAPKIVQNNLNIKEKINKKTLDVALAKEIEGFFVCFEQHLGKLCDNRAELRFLLTDKTSRQSKNDDDPRKIYPGVFENFEAGRLRTRFLKESFVKACGRHNLLK